jgi:hypothetical protein
MSKLMDAIKRKKNRHADYKQTFESLAGQRVLHDLMATCGAMRSSFVKDNSHETAFREGQRNVFLKIMTELKITPEQFDAMIVDAQRLDKDW